MITMQNILIDFVLLVLMLLFFVVGTLMTFSPPTYVRFLNWWRRGVVWPSTYAVYSAEPLRTAARRGETRLVGVIFIVVATISIVNLAKQLIVAFSGEAALTHTASVSSPVPVAGSHIWINATFALVCLFFGVSFLLRPLATLKTIWSKWFTDDYLSDTKLPGKLKLMGVALIGLAVFSLVLSLTR